MNIAINLTQFKEITGLEVYARELTKRFGLYDPDDHYFIFINKLDLGELHFKFSNYTYVKCNTSPKNQLFYHFYLQFIFPIKLSLLKIDSVFNPAFSHSFFTRRMQVVCIPDCIYLENKDYNQNGWLKRAYMKILISSALKRTRVITISKFSKQEIACHFPKNRNNIQVIYPGFTNYPLGVKDQSEILKKFNLLDKRYLFYIGLLVPHKNIANIVKAFEKVAGSDKNLYLVLAGKKRSDLLDIDGLISNCFFGRRIILTRAITEKEKIVLYKNASIFLFPSLHEGFGLPILESQYFKTPVITSHLSSMPEIAGEGAALVNPDSTIEISRAIHELLNNTEYRGELVAKGSANIRRFSWDNATKAIILLLVKQ